jgi:hypothetical protein
MAMYHQLHAEVSRQLELELELADISRFAITGVDLQHNGSGILHDSLGVDLLQKAHGVVEERDMASISQAQAFKNE